MDKNKPVIANTKPIGVELDQDEKYWWCVCGRSQNQPFCDGSHKTTNLKPLPFNPEESGECYLCMCKHTSNPPYCDGTHSTLRNKT